MTERNSAQQYASVIKLPEDWKKYKDLRNTVNNTLKNEKDKWKREKLDNCDNNSGKLWKNIIGWLNWSSSGSPSQLFHDGKLEIKPSK